MSLNYRDDCGHWELGNGKNWDNYFGKDHIPGSKRALFGIPFSADPAPDSSSSSSSPAPPSSSSSLLVENDTKDRPTTKEEDTIISQNIAIIEDVHFWNANHRLEAYGYNYTQDEQQILFINFKIAADTTDDTYFRIGDSDNNWHIGDVNAYALKLDDNDTVHPMFLVKTVERTLYVHNDEDADDESKDSHIVYRFGQLPKDPWLGVLNNIGQQVYDLSRYPDPNSPIRSVEIVQVQLLPVKTITYVHNETGKSIMLHPGYILDPRPDASIWTMLSKDSTSRVMYHSLENKTFTQNVYDFPQGYQVLLPLPTYLEQMSDKETADLIIAKEAEEKQEKRMERASYDLAYMQTLGSRKERLGFLLSIDEERQAQLLSIMTITESGQLRLLLGKDEAGREKYFEKQAQFAKDRMNKRAAHT